VCNHSISLRTGAALCVAVLLAVSAPSARAETIQIDFTGVNFVLDDVAGLTGVHLFDAKQSNTARALSTSQSDRLSTVEFTVADTVNRDIGEVYVDFFVKDTSKILEDGGVALSGGNGDTFGLDLFGVVGGTVAWKLQLDIDQLSLLYYENPFTGKPLGFAAVGEATVFGQDLPFGLDDIDTSKDVTISISASNMWDVTDNGMYLTGFSATATGNVTGELVPEPSTLAGVLMGCLVLAAAAWARRRR
jgi:hypothetical protein